MRRFSFILVLAAMIGAPLFSRAEVVDGVRAVVADRVVTFAEIEEITRPAITALNRQYMGDPEMFNRELKKAINDSLEFLVQRALILHEFDAGGYRLPDTFVDQLMQERIREKFGDRVTLIKTLQQQGMTYEQFRKQIREQFIETQLRHQNIQREIVISPFKIQNYYDTHAGEFKVEEQVKLRMIVLGKSAEDDTNAMATAREILGKLKEGASFAEMATLYSQGSQQHQGGDMGWVEPAKLRPELAGPADTLKPGVVSEPIDSSDTVYLILVEEKKSAHARPLADIRPEIEKTLRVQQQAQLEKKWIDGLKKKTFVRYFE